MEEVCENLVKIFLEQQGYLVTTNKRVPLNKFTKTLKVKQSAKIQYEVDIIAINPLRKKYIVGEVKGTKHGLTLESVKELRIINNKNYKRKLNNWLNEKYGKKFDCVLYVDHIKEKEKEKIEKFREKKKFKIVTFKEILDYLYNECEKINYSNDLTQIFRVEKRLKEEEKWEKFKRLSDIKEFEELLEEKWRERKVNKSKKKNDDKDTENYKLEDGIFQQKKKTDL